MSEMSDAVRNLMAMNAEVVSAKYIAPILRMSESVLIHRVKSGQWDQDTLGKVVISGNRVKFFRKDFLVKCGFMDPEPTEKTVEQLLAEIVSELRILNSMTLASMDLRQRMTYELMEQKETADAATPAE